jgi:hypothetical protein
MRYATVLLVLFSLHGSAAAQLEFFTVEEIFEVINFLAAHPASPADYSTVSPFGPEASETRMPETFDDLASSILHCYHHSDRYQLADIMQTPWDRQGQYGGDSSALIRIRYFGASSGNLYEMNVGLVARQNQLRTAVLNDNSPVPWSANCQLDTWTTLKRQ